MKLNNNNQVNFQSNTAFDGHDAKISQDDIHKLWYLLQNH